MDGGGGDVCCLPMVGWGMFIRPILLLELFFPQGSGWNLFCFLQPVVDRSIRVEHLTYTCKIFVSNSGCAGCKAGGGGGGAGASF